MKTVLIESTQIGAYAPNLDVDGTLVVLPVIDSEMGKKAAKLAASRANANGVVLLVLDSARIGLVKIHNQVFQSSKSTYYVYLAQDAFVGRDWLSLGVAALNTQGSGAAGLLGFNDGKWQGQLASFGLARREWVNEVYGGSFFFEGYSSHYADTELTLIAREQGRYAYEPNAVVIEVDWDKDTKPSTNLQDKNLFKTRAQQGFGGRVVSSELKGLFS
jgi:GT2 family glycosyltransferase